MRGYLSHQTNEANKEKAGKIKKYFKQSKMTLKQFLENCAYCGSTVELIIGANDEHRTTYSISCKPCRNFSGEHIGIFGEQSSIDSWNEQQRRFKKYAVLKEPDNHQRASEYDDKRKT